MNTDIIVQNISIDPDGDMHVSYLSPDADTKDVGLVHLHTLLVPAGYDYDDEMRAVVEAAAHLVRDVLDDWNSIPGPT